MKTARYSNKAINNEKYTPVQVSVGTPKFPLHYHLKDRCMIITPAYQIIKIEDEEEYKKQYIAQLEKHGIEKIRWVLRQMAEPGKQIVLLCYEDVRKEGVWCHRRMFAEWYEAKTGNKVEELEEPVPITRIAKETVERERKAQLFLF